jgi:hypothetical protein
MEHIYSSSRRPLLLSALGGMMKIGTLLGGIAPQQQIWIIQNKVTKKVFLADFPGSDALKKQCHTSPSVPFTKSCGYWLQVLIIFM